MRVIASVVIAGLALVAACSIPEKKFSEPYGCDSSTLPPVPETVTISGTVKDPVNGKLQAPNATVEVLQVPSLPFVLPFQTDASGAFSLSHGTGMAKRDVYFHVTATGYKDTYFFPSLPLVGDVDVTILLFTPSAIGQLATALQQMGQPVAPDPAKALLIVSAVDCNGDPVGGAKIATTSTEGTMVYLDTGVTPNVTANQTDPTTGSALVLNASPSSLTVSASTPDHVLHAHSITAFADAVNQTEIQP